MKTMSVALGRKILTHFCGSQFKRLSVRGSFVRFKSTALENNLSSLEDSAKSDVQASEQNKFSAAVLKEFSEPLVIENYELPESLQPNEVLIDVQYCALNTSDALLSKNLYTFQPILPIVLGYELMGKLVEIGEEAQKNGYKVGDKVIALNKERYGGLAERCTAEIGDVWKIPSGVKSLDAVTLLDDYISALVALERKVEVQEDDMIIINVGLSSIGLAAADLATNVFRAKVIGISATEDGAALVREKGAYASLKFKERTLMKEIEAAAAEKNIKAIFDDSDGKYFKKVLSCFTDIYNDTKTKVDLLRDDNFAVVVHHLSREGRVVIAGSTKTPDEHSDVQKGSFSVTGLNLREYRKKKPEVYRLAGDEVLQFFEEGLIKPNCSMIVGLNKVNDAIKSILESKTSIKVIVNLKDKNLMFDDRELYYRYLLKRYYDGWNSYAI